MTEKLESLNCPNFKWVLKLGYKLVIIAAFGVLHGIDYRNKSN